MDKEVKRIRLQGIAMKDTDTILPDYEDIKFCSCGKSPVRITKLEGEVLYYKYCCACGMETAFRQYVEDAILDWNSKVLL